MPAAVVMEAFLDTLSLHAGVGHRHRMLGYEDKGNSLLPMLDNANIAAGHSGVSGSVAAFLALIDSENDIKDS
eukprot:1706530-Ditylum_brightwellii.AAC.1